MHGWPFGSWKRSGEANQSPSIPKSGFSTLPVWWCSLYGCESWVLSVNMENKINAFATSCYRIMLGIKHLDCVRNTQIHEMTDTQPLINTVRQRQLCFLGHILRMPEDEPCRRYALFIPTHGRRRPGRRRTSYISMISYVQKLLGYTENDLHQDAIASLATDWSTWRKFVVRLLLSQMMTSMIRQAPVLRDREVPLSATPEAGLVHFLKKVTPT